MKREILHKPIQAPYTAKNMKKEDSISMGRHGLAENFSVDLSAESEKRDDVHNLVQTSNRGNANAGITARSGTSMNSAQQSMMRKKTQVQKRRDVLKMLTTKNLDVEQLKMNTFDHLNDNVDEYGKIKRYIRLQDEDGFSSDDAPHGKCCVKKEKKKPGAEMFEDPDAV